MIRAEVHPDDHAREIHFDATPWFEAASVEEIIELSASKATYIPDEWRGNATDVWGQDLAGDAVAVFMTDHDEDVKGVFTYIEWARGSNNYMGFECYVHADDARKWLEAERPHLLYLIDSEEDEDTPDEFELSNNGQIIAAWRKQDPAVVLIAHNYSFYRVGRYINKVDAKAEIEDESPLGVEIDKFLGTIKAGLVTEIEDDEEGTTFKLSPPGTPKQRITGAAEAILHEVPDNSGQAVTLSYAQVRKVRGYVENIFIQLNKLEQSPEEPWHDNLVQFARLITEMSELRRTDDDHLADSMDLEVDEVHTLFERALVEFQRAKNSGRVLRETPYADMQAMSVDPGAIT